MIPAPARFRRRRSAAGRRAARWFRQTALASGAGLLCLAAALVWLQRSTGPTPHDHIPAAAPADLATGTRVAPGDQHAPEPPSEALDDLALEQQCQQVEMSMSQLEQQWSSSPAAELAEVWERTASELHRSLDDLSRRIDADAIEAGTFRFPSPVPKEQFP